MRSYEVSDKNTGIVVGYVQAETRADALAQAKTIWPQVENRRVVLAVKP